MGILINTAILLCAALLAADNPAQLQAEVLYGSGPRNEQLAERQKIRTA